MIEGTASQPFKGALAWSALTWGALAWGALGHWLVWAGLPALVERSLRLDTAEGAFTGLEWQLSYAKHPPLSEWLTALAWHMGPLRYLTVYLIAQAFVVGAVWCLVRWMARQYGPGAATFTLVIGLLSPYATYLPIQFNHNVTVTLFWALTLVMAWEAFESRKVLAWLGLGLAVGLGLWAKYSILHQAVGIGLAFVAVPAWRAQWCTRGPWIAAVTALLVASPHLWDASHRGLTTVQYALHTVDMTPTEIIGFMGNMLMNITLIFTFTGLVATALVGWPHVRSALQAKWRAPFATRQDVLVNFALIAPLAIMLAAPLFHIRARPLWLTPSLVPVVLWWGQCLARSGLPNIAPKRLTAVVGVFGSLFVGCYLLAELHSPSKDMRHYAAMDGAALAGMAHTYWAAHAKGDLPIIVTISQQAERQAAGSIVFDSPHQIHVYERASPVLSPWIKPEDLRRQGALVIGIPDIPAGAQVEGRLVTDVRVFERPMAHYGRTKPIAFGFLPPAP